MQRNAPCARISAVVLILSLWFAFADRQLAGEERPRLTPPPRPPKTLNALPLLFTDDFESGQTDRWQPTDPQCWRIEQQAENHVYSQFNKKSSYRPPVRSPLHRSLVRDILVGNFVLDVRLQSTHPDYGHRDLCLFFGYQDDAHLYYVHLGKKTDNSANQIFIVNGKDRVKISSRTTAGTNWDDQWHHARISRDVKIGMIDVFFDDMDEAIMQAVDKTFTQGRVGVGSFDDTGNFDHVRIYGEHVAQPTDK